MQSIEPLIEACSCPSHSHAAPLLHPDDTLPDSLCSGRASLLCPAGRLHHGAQHSSKSCRSLCSQQRSCRSLCAQQCSPMALCMHLPSWGCVHPGCRPPLITAVPLWYHSASQGSQTVRTGRLAKALQGDEGGSWGAPPWPLAGTSPSMSPSDSSSSPSPSSSSSSSAGRLTQKGSPSVCSR